MALKSITTENVAEALLDLFSRLGFPEEILSDMGTQFISDCMKEVERLLCLKHITTSPYHPQCNGLVEKFNGTFKTMLKRMCSGQPKQWHRYINALLFAYRKVPQDTTGFSPFDLLYGGTVPWLMRILKELWSNSDAESEVISCYQYVFDLRERLDETFKLVNDNLTKAQARYKRNFKAKQRNFSKGDLVLVLLPTDKNKLLMHWKGPFEIDSQIGANNYKVAMGGKLKTWHVNTLKRYFSRDTSAKGLAGSVNEEVVVEEHSDFDCNDLLEFPVVVAKETIDDVTLDSQLSSEQRSELSDVLKDYVSVFSDLPGTIDLVQHKIELTSDQPVCSKPYPVPFKLQEELRGHIKEMLNLSIIRRSDSAYASPIVLVRKKDGTNRLCIDYRKLNKVTLFDPQPMTNTTDVLEKLSGGKFFSTIDLTKG